jgi:hypothetical protein
MDKAVFDDLVFRPDIFFLGPTQGWGLVRDGFGRLIDRCAIATEGRWDHNFGALHFDESFTYDSGHVETLNWSFAPDPQGRMSAAEPSVLGRPRAWYEGRDYRLQFRRLGPPPVEKARLLYDVTFTLLQPNMALKSARLKLFGVTVGSLTAYHRQVREKGSFPKSQRTAAHPGQRRDERTGAAVLYR